MPCKAQASQSVSSLPTKSRVHDPTLTIDQIRETLRISRSTYYRYVSRISKDTNLEFGV